MLSNLEFLRCHGDFKAIPLPPGKSVSNVPEEFNRGIREVTLIYDVIIQQRQNGPLHRPSIERH